MDSNFTETLLVQSLEEMTWQLEGTKENQTPFLILNLSCDEEIKEGSSTTINISNHATTLFLMVTGSQTLLIDALMNTMTGRRLERAISDVSCECFFDFLTKVILSRVAPRIPAQALPVMRRSFNQD